LQNEFGIQRKVIVIERGVRCLNRPGGELTGQPLRFFWPYFVFETWPAQGEPRYYRVGTTPRKESILGWVPAAVAAPWDTRVGKRYVPNYPLLVYRDKQALIDLLEKASTREEPIARAAGTGPQAWMPWPVAASEQVTVRGKVHELVQIQFLAEYRAGADLARPDRAPGSAGPSYSDAEVERIKSGVKMLDVVFVVDNTLSTTPYLVAIRETIKAIAQRLHELPFRPNLCCGLVLYRDYVTAIMFHDDAGRPTVTKCFPMQTDLAAFLRTVEPLQCATDGSEDLPEAVYDGVLAGLNEPWRGDGLSNRVVILIGDNSAHPPGHAKNPHNITPEALIQLARGRDRNVKVFGVCINGEGGAEEQRLHRAQWEQLARGTAGECYTLDDNPAEVADRIVGCLRPLLEKQTAVVHDRFRTVEMLQQGKTREEILAETDMDVRKLVDVMEFLQGAGVDVDRIGPGVPTFASGWCLNEVRGRPVLDTEVYLARSELDLLLGELNVLCSRLSPDFGRQLLERGLGARIHPASFFSEPRPESMDVYFLKQGVPCPNGILKFTQQEIEHMSEQDRALLRERVARQVVPQLTNARNDDRSFTWLNDVEFGWIKESLLP
jgi:hypothetical protein